MSRIGKIARLPKAVRDELNRRLEDGEEGKELVAWLNGHAEVHPPSPGLRQAGAAECDRQPDWVRNPINESNLTAWRQGGFEDWRRQQEAMDAASRMLEESAELDAVCRGGPSFAEASEGKPGGKAGSGVARLVDRVATMAALALGEQFMAVRRMEDGDEKRKAVLKLVRGLVRLRKSDRECERGMREAAQAERAAEVHDHWAASRQAQAKRNVWSGAEESDVRRKMTEVIARMSDEQIAESLRRSGYLPAAELAGKRVWWTDEDQAFEEAELAKEKEAEEAERTLNAQRVTPNAHVTSSSDLPPEGGTQPSPGSYGGQATRTEATASTILPPEGGTTNTSMSTLLRQGFVGQASTEGADPSGRKAPPTVQTETAGSGAPGPTCGGLIQS